MTAVAQRANRAGTVGSVWSCHCRQVTHLPAFLTVAETGDRRRHRRNVCMSHDAPAWDGDLTVLDDDQLRRRHASLAHHIAALHTVSTPDGGWRAARPDEVAGRGLQRWVEARLAVLRELDARSASTSRSVR